MKEEKSVRESSNGAEKPSSLNRRDFLKALGSGIIISFAVGDSTVLLQERRRRGFGGDYPTDFNAYLRIGEDGRITCFSGKIEMGQGIITGLALMCAEELDVPLDSVDMVMGDTAVCPWDMMTVGSRTTREFGPRLRRAAAEARAILVKLGADRMELPEDRLATKAGFVLERNNPNNKVSYASLTNGKRIEKHLDGEPKLKPASEYTLCGKPFVCTDAHEKVTGSAKFTGDIKVDGMLHARLLRPPAHGAKLRSVDTSAAEKIEGVRVVRDGDLVAALHRHFDVADRALSKIKAQFDSPTPTVDNNTIHDHLLKVAPEGQVVDEKGDLDEGKKLASITFDETYYNGYVAHAPIETHTSVAHVEGDKITVWASTQGPFMVQPQVAGALGIPEENVRVITPFVGGGFGGKTAGYQIIEAARLSKLAGKPVQVAWTREEEFFFDTFMPAAVVKIRSGLNDSNQIVFWDYAVYFGGSRSSEPFYAIPHFKVVTRGSWGRRGSAATVHPFGVGAWRGPGSNTNTFAREAHIDIMAAKVGMDPLEFRLKNLKDARMIRVLSTAADKFGWTHAKFPSGRGYGISCINYLNTYVATIAEVEVNKKTGDVRVKRIVCAQDMGEVVNPEGARAQMAGGITMGLGFALSEEIQFKGGKVLTASFDNYDIPRFSWTPEIETILVENKALPPQGGGEPAITTVGGLITNAVHDAIGVKLCRLPLTRERVKAAMST